ncbi:hypothetical protein Tsubulata_042547 [Turnera subulata]|uniref:Uncharacterized protein n=1 Tax=Turnera subulata TaxID=218843 RepID=A0A9Q0FIA3_9ROSI|nr:hypothetical protein Tsubulata_042547 [Turnera subulata]
MLLGRRKSLLVLIHLGEKLRWLKASVLGWYYASDVNISMSGKVLLMQWKSLVLGEGYNNLFIYLKNVIFIYYVIF